MADQSQSKTNAAQGNPHERSIRSAVVGATIVQCIVAIFLINILNSVNGKLEGLNQRVESLISVPASAQLTNFQLVDQEGNVVHTFRQVAEVIPGAIDRKDAPAPTSE